MTFMHRFRRRARRAAKVPRRTWRRVYSYREDTLEMQRVVIRTPVSHDAPYEDQDARF